MNCSLSLHAKTCSKCIIAFKCSVPTGASQQWGVEKVLSNREVHKIVYWSKKGSYLPAFFT
jgi:hypothetical protein